MRSPELPSLNISWLRSLMAMLAIFMINNYIEPVSSDLKESDRPCNSITIMSEEYNSPEWKMELVRKTMPYLLVSREEKYNPNEFGVLAQVEPYTSNLSCPYLNREGIEPGDIIATYAFLYKQDEGIHSLKATIFEQFSITVPDEILNLLTDASEKIKNSHPGDIEQVRLILSYDPFTHELKIKFVEVKIHGRGFVRYEPNVASCSDGNRPDIFVSEGKNTNYVSKETCDTSYGLKPIPELKGLVPITFSGDTCNSRANSRRVNPLEMFDRTHLVSAVPNAPNPFPISPLLTAFKSNDLNSSYFEKNRAGEFNFCKTITFSKN